MEGPSPVGTHQLQEGLALAKAIEACVLARIEETELAAADVKRINRWAAVQSYPQLLALNAGRPRFAQHFRAFALVNVLKRLQTWPVTGVPSRRPGGARTADTGALVSASNDRLKHPASGEQASAFCSAAQTGTSRPR
jgi:hypothetical protein